MGIPCEFADGSTCRPRQFINACLGLPLFEDHCALIGYEGDPRRAQTIQCAIRLLALGQAIKPNLHIEYGPGESLADIAGQWPGDETDEEIAEGLAALEAPTGGLFRIPPLDITGGMDPADYLEAMRERTGPWADEQPPLEEVV